MPTEQTHPGGRAPRGPQTLQHGPASILHLLPWQWRWWRWGHRCRPAACGTTGCRCGRLCRTEWRSPGTRRRRKLRGSSRPSSPSPRRRGAQWCRWRRSPAWRRSYRTAEDAAGTMDATGVAVCKHSHCSCRRAGKQEALSPAASGCQQRSSTDDDAHYVVRNGVNSLHVLSLVTYLHFQTFIRIGF